MTREERIRKCRDNLARMAGGMRTRVSGAASESGQSVVEMALALPVLLLVVMGILWFGVTLYDYITLAQATQVALRQVVVGRGQVTDPCSTVISSVTSSFASMDMTKLGGTLTVNGVAYSAFSCPAASANMVLGAPVVVTLTYPAKLPIAFDVISRGFTLTAQAQDKIQ